MRVQVWPRWISCKVGVCVDDDALLDGLSGQNLAVCPEKNRNREKHHVISPTNRQTKRLSFTPSKRRQRTSSTTIRKTPKFVIGISKSRSGHHPRIRLPESFPRKWIYTKGDRVTISIKYAGKLAKNPAKKGKFAYDTKNEEKSDPVKNNSQVMWKPPSRRRSWNEGGKVHPHSHKEFQRRKEKVSQL